MKSDPDPRSPSAYMLLGYHGGTVLLAPSLATSLFIHHACIDLHHALMHDLQDLAV
jgi:hypothetical protein